MESGYRTLQLNALVPCNIHSRHHQAGTWGTPTPLTCWASQHVQECKTDKNQEWKQLKHKTEGLPGMPGMVCCNLSLPVRFGKLWMDRAHPWRVPGNNVQPAARVTLLGQCSEQTQWLLTASLDHPIQGRRCGSKSGIGERGTRNNPSIHKLCVAFYFAEIQYHVRLPFPT